MMNSKPQNDGPESNDPATLTTFGNTLCQQGRLDEAVEAYQRAVEVDPCYCDAWQNLVVVYQMQGETSKAVEACLRYLAIQPDDGKLLHNLGLMYQELGQKQNAMQAFAAAEFYLKPNDAESATCLGSARLFQRQSDTALEAFQIALDIDPDYLPATYYVGVCQLMLGDVDDAIETLEMVVERQPDYPQAAENLSVAYMTAGRPEHAVPILESLASAHQPPASVLENLAMARGDLANH